MRLVANKKGTALQTRIQLAPATPIMELPPEKRPAFLLDNFLNSMNRRARFAPVRSETKAKSTKSGFTELPQGKRIRKINFNLVIKDAGEKIKFIRRSLFVKNTIRE